jgi:hypothetical protein
LRYADGVLPGQGSPDQPPADDDDDDSPTQQSKVAAKTAAGERQVTVSPIHYGF